MPREAAAGRQDTHTRPVALCSGLPGQSVQPMPYLLLAYIRLQLTPISEEGRKAQGHYKKALLHFSGTHTEPLLAMVPGGCAERAEGRPCEQGQAGSMGFPVCCPMSRGQHSLLMPA